MAPVPTTNKLAINISNSWKMYSQRFLALISIAVSGAVAWFFGLPEDCAPLLAKIPPEACTQSQLSVLAIVFGKFGWSVVAIPTVSFAIQWIFRVWPQVNLALAESTAKSADAPQTPVEVPSIVASTAEAIKPEDTTTTKE